VSAASALDHCRIRPRSSMDQPQITVASALDDCMVYMQKRKSLDAEFCGSRAAEEGSRKLWIMIDFTKYSIGYSRVF